MTQSAVKEAKALDNSSSTVDRKEQYFEADATSYPIFMISALEDDGVDDILNLLITKAKPSVEENTIQDTKLSPKHIATEIIREKVYRYLHKEIPHRVSFVGRLFQTRSYRDKNSQMEKKTIPTNRTRLGCEDKKSCTNIIRESRIINQPNKKGSTTGTVKNFQLPGRLASTYSFDSKK